MLFGNLKKAQLINGDFKNLCENILFLTNIVICNLKVVV